MKTIRELRTQLRFAYYEINSHLFYMHKHLKVDFDVYLKSKKQNLQRELIWNLEQKRELIWSILRNRKIPRMAIMVIGEDYLVIDGKQRLSTMFDFYEDNFTLLIDDKEYFYSELPQDYKTVIRGYAIPYYVAHEDYEDKFTDQDKIDWFKLVNFAGTAQDKKHLDKFLN